MDTQQIEREMNAKRAEIDRKLDALGQKADGMRRTATASLPVALALTGLTIVTFWARQRRHARQRRRLANAITPPAWRSGVKRT